MTLRRKASLFCWVLGAALAITLGLRGGLISFPLEREIWWLRASGYLAAGFLFLSLAATPFWRLRDLFRWKGASKGSLMAFRRAFGITAAAFGLIHGILVVTLYLESSWKVIFAVPYLRAGAVALGILLALLGTSFPRLNRSLRIRLWRELHRLSYGALFFLALHLLLSPFTPKAWSLVFCALVMVLLGLRALPQRKKAPSEVGSGVNLRDRR